jgi:agmatine/peptidylarginine deiminase
LAVAVAGSSADPNAAALQANRERLRHVNDQDGRRLAVVELPPPPTHRVNGEICPASYANFYFANGVALVPTFAAETDARALATLREVLPGRDVVGLRAATSSRGSLRCTVFRNRSRPRKWPEIVSNVTFGTRIRLSLGPRIGYYF